MLDFIQSAVLWTLALYGLIEIIKEVINIFTYTSLKSEGIYFIIAVKNQEEKIEGFLRSTLFRILYGKEDIIEDFIIADLNSTDNTKEIMKRLGVDYDGIKITSWKECKEIVDNISNNERGKKSK